MEDKKEVHEHHEGEHEHHEDGEHVEHHEATTKKTDPFSIFGKVIAAVVVVALLIAGGMYLGNSMNKNQASPAPTPSTANTNVSQSPSITTTQTTPTTTQLAKLDKSQTAGGANGTSFSTYNVDYPSSWTPNHEKTDVTDSLKLTKGAYSIAIYQAPSEGGQCIYPPDAEGPFSQSFKKYTEIQGAQNKLRRSWNDEAATISYTVCQSSDGKTYGYPTSFGYTTVKAPNPADAATMTEIDAILASLTKK